MVDHNRGKQWSISRLIDAFPHCSPLDFVPQQAELAATKYRSKEAGVMQHKWFYAAIDAITSIPDPRFSLLLENLEHDVLSFDTNTLRSGVEWSTSLKDMPNPSPAWTPLISAARFVESPSQATLAGELRAITRGFEYNLVQWAASRMLWPLGACVATVDNEDQLRELANRVDAGDFGSLGDWEAAEERWLKNDVTRNDLDYMIDEHWPFDQNVASLGFPFAGASAWLSADRPTAETLLQLLLSIYAQHQGNNLRSEIAELVVFVLGWLKDSASYSAASLQLEQFRSLASDAPQSIWLINVIETCLLHNTSNQEWIKLLDDIGKQPQLTLRTKEGPSEALVKLAVREFCASPTQTGILRLLSLLALRGARFSVPTTLVDPAQFNDSMFREAAIIVRVAQGFDHQQEAAVMARHVAELVQTQPERVVDMLSATSEQRAASAYNDYFLLELLKQMPNVQWKIVDQLINDLNDCLRRRTSRLDDFGLWLQLGLPAGLNNI